MGLNLKTTTGKVIASLALVGTAAGVAGLGTYGAFTSSTSASNTVASGTVAIALGTPGTAGNRLSVAASGLVPGDTVQRTATLSNAAGNQALSAVTLTTSALPTSKLDTDGTNGLQMVIDNCSVPWTEAGTAPAYTYTCSGTTTSVLTTRAVTGSNLALANLNSVTAGQSDNLRVTLTLPSTADNTFQNLSSTVAFNFTGTQRTGTNK
ncbi:TasA family protein [Arthrobacter sp. efr-133-R2A-63]|uniref:TasA family protein n=1 Tax=Arthrobacter sp. efr-133-R2A-63 TaxID=3040278 RepID=UPI0025518C21|nr:TasA family protein [Arthrobacter sp. efr-133-R2A-63]